MRRPSWRRLRLEGAMGRRRVPAPPSPRTRWWPAILGPGRLRPRPRARGRAWARFSSRSRRSSSGGRTCRRRPRWCAPRLQSASSSVSSSVSTSGRPRCQSLCTGPKGQRAGSPMASLSSRSRLSSSRSRIRRRRPRRRLPQWSWARSLEGTPGRSWSQASSKSPRGPGARRLSARLSFRGRSRGRLRPRPRARERVWARCSSRSRRSSSGGRTCRRRTRWCAPRLQLASSSVRSSVSTSGRPSCQTQCKSPQGQRAGSSTASISSRSRLSSSRFRTRRR
mmetsp:Transcript_114085/g.368996  ORF Transcript_114085/g.368996 Transcript_114085/m.368996 type:complete len:280 (-) Transcript_114085:55-894(-)